MSSTAIVQPEAVPDGSMPQVPALVPYNPANASAPSASLYVRELDPSITKANLFENFST
jgi:polyadenylate-binding protein